MSGYMLQSAGSHRDDGKLVFLADLEKTPIEIFNACNTQLSVSGVDSFYISVGGQTMTFERGTKSQDFQNALKEILQKKPKIEEVGGPDEVADYQSPVVHVITDGMKTEGGKGQGQQPHQ